MSEIMDWHPPDHDWKKVLLILLVPFCILIPTPFYEILDRDPIPFIFIPLIFVIISMILGTSFKKNQKVQMVAIILFGTSSMSLVGFAMLLQGGPILLILMVLMISLLLGGLILWIYMIERKVELITIIHKPPISPYLMEDLNRYIYWALKNNDMDIKNYTNQMEVFYKGNMFKIIIKANTFNKEDNAEYSIVCRTKGKMDDPEFRTVKETISEGLGNLLSRRKIDDYPRPVEVICRRGHTRVPLQPATGQYYCTKCKKVYSQDKVKITWDPPV